MDRIIHNSLPFDLTRIRFPSLRKVLIGAKRNGLTLLEIAQESMTGGSRLPEALATGMNLCSTTPIIAIRPLRWDETDEDLVDAIFSEALCHADWIVERRRTGSAPPKPPVNLLDDMFIHIGLCHLYQNRRDPGLDAAARMHLAWLERLEARITGNVTERTVMEWQIRGLRYARDCEAGA